ncbi:MAG: phenylalanine--tRNA ligase subunit beta [Candidatus Aenigmarchaeota archaeon]|nr:phenylalanine--tRNA ligase subunit beta [Candidatus Aenigmarchaeota archaeon]
MPTIEVNIKILEKLSGKKVTEGDLEVVKGELQVKGNKAKIEIGDTNRPDLWCVEGVARVMRGYYGKTKGLPKMNAKNSGKKILVDTKLSKIRPFIAGFIAKDIKIDEELLLDLIQLQDKLAENYGKKRKKISVGIYNYDRIKFPVNYKAVDPTKLSFAPLDFEKTVNLQEILKEHPKGIEYGYILHEHKLYPIFVDAKDDVLSFPPIINSNYIGKVEPGSQNLFIEVTGTDHKAVLIAANIFAYSLQDRGSNIQSVVSEYPWKTKYGKSVQCPYDFKEQITFDKTQVENVLGIQLKDNELINILQRMQYDAKISKDTVTVNIPSYRNDIMHSTDVIEDIGMCYGYENLGESPIGSFTVGKLKDESLFSERSKRIMVGLGFQEIMSAILSNKQNLCKKMLLDEDTIEIDNIMSESYSAVRNWVLPSILQCLVKNMHTEYPQRIFEFGEVVIRDGNSLDHTRTVNKLCAGISDISIGYEQMASYLDGLLSSFGLSYTLEKIDHNSFINGRTAKIIVDGREIGIVGEVHPQVLNNFGLEKAVVAFELDADALFHLSNKK